MGYRSGQRHHDHVLFGTDCPFDPEGGPMYIRETIRAIESLNLPVDVCESLYSGNARRLLRLGDSVPKPR